jgi:TetR/AcrR family transcriptional regulator
MPPSRLPIKRTGRKTRNPDLARETILNTARKHFVARGLAGARMDEIAKEARYSKAMLYHYFGSKDALYIAVLEQTYREDIASHELVDISEVGPIVALEKFVREGAESVRKDPSILLLLSIENIYGAKYLRKSGIPGKVYEKLKGHLKKIVDEGERTGVFRSGIDVTELYLLFGSLVSYPVSNKSTLSLVLGKDISTARFMNRYIDSAVEMTIRFCVELSPRLTRKSHPPVRRR